DFRKRRIPRNVLGWLSRSGTGAVNPALSFHGTDRQTSSSECVALPSKLEFAVDARIHSLQFWLTKQIERLDPGAFALVMATGIISNALVAEGAARIVRRAFGGDLDRLLLPWRSHRSAGCAVLHVCGRISSIPAWCSRSLPSSRQPASLAAGSICAALLRLHRHYGCSR